MDAQFELHRQDDRQFENGEDERIFLDAIKRTLYPMALQGITRENGFVTATIRFIGIQQYYKLQLLCRELQKTPDIQFRYREMNT